MASDAKLVEQFERFNDNFERWLSWLGVRPAPTAEQMAMSAHERTVLGEPLSEFEQALKEHAELTGQTYERAEEDQ